MPAPSAGLRKLLFYASVYRTNEVTKQALLAIKQSICLDVYGTVSGCSKKRKKAKNVVLVVGTQQNLSNLFL